MQLCKLINGTTIIISFLSTDRKQCKQPHHNRKAVWYPEGVRYCMSHLLKNKSIKINHKLPNMLSLCMHGSSSHSHTAVPCIVPTLSWIITSIKASDHQTISSLDCSAINPILHWLQCNKSFSEVLIIHVYMYSWINKRTFMVQHQNR